MRIATDELHDAGPAFDQGRAVTAAAGAATIAAHMVAVAPLVRRTLFEGEVMHVGHVVARPTSAEHGPVESQADNVLALPLAGVFAKHDSARRHFIATANHAVLVAANQPYRVSFPGAVGDRCLTLRLSGEALARTLPEAVRRDGFDLASFAPHALLSPRAMLARSALWHRLARRQVDPLKDPLEIEELGVTALAAALDADAPRCAPLAGELRAADRAREGGDRGRARSPVDARRAGGARRHDP